MATRTRPTRGVSAGAEARERQPVEGGGWVGGRAPRWWDGMGWGPGPRGDGRACCLRLPHDGCEWARANGVATLGGCRTCRATRWK